MSAVSDDDIERMIRGLTIMGGQILPDGQGYVVGSAIAMLQSLRDERAKLAQDAARLDFLDRLNTTLNSTYGTKYRWKLILSHNVIRLMSGRGGNGLVADIDLHDSSPSANGYPSCRGAIDAAMAGREGDG